MAKIDTRSPTANSSRHSSVGLLSSHARYIRAVADAARIPTNHSSDHVLLLFPEWSSQSPLGSQNTVDET